MPHCLTEHTYCSNCRVANNNWWQFFWPLIAYDTIWLNPISTYDENMPQTLFFFLFKLRTGDDPKLQSVSWPTARPFSFLSRCAVITEFARDLLAQRGVKLVVPGEKEKVVVSLSEETNEGDVQTEEKNGAQEPKLIATAGEKCEVCTSPEPGNCLM